MHPHWSSYVGPLNSLKHSGGLEILFDNKSKHKISIPKHSPDGSLANIKFLVDYLCDNIMKDSRKELFVVENDVYGRCYSSIFNTN